MLRPSQSRVLLTGSTGFLGTQTVRRLVSLGDSHIFALVRARDHSHARMRLRRAWHEQPELLRALDNQVTAVAGDICREDLGLPVDAFEDLSSHLTHIIHTAADLRLHAPLEELCQVNLQGTRNLINLAERAVENRVFQRFSHLSTAYVAGRRNGWIPEEPDINDPGGGDAGFWSAYEESKSAAESALRASRVPFSIFRPGMIVGDSHTGEIKTFNTLYVLLKFYLTGRLRLVPTRSDLVLNMIPVDYVAQAVIDLTFNPQAKGRIFHLTAPHDSLPTIQHLLDEVRRWACQHLDVRLARSLFVPAAPLIQRLARFYSRTRPEKLQVLLTLAPYLDEQHRFSRENSDAFLGSYALDWKEYLPHLLAYAVRYGFFHRSERTVHEQVVYRLKSRRYPVSCFDITPEGVRKKSTSDLGRDISSARRALLASGVCPGDRVALVGLNSSRYLTLETAIGLAGAVSVPFYYTSPPQEIKTLLADCGARILFIGTPHLVIPLAEANLQVELISFCRSSQTLPPGMASWEVFLKRGEKGLHNPEAPVDFSALATIRYTSGTTGIPKGVTFTHAHLRWLAECMASLPSWTDRTRRVRYLSFLPMNHVVEGILGTLSPYYAPAALELYFLEEFSQLARGLRRSRPTIFFSVPRFYEKLWCRFGSGFLGKTWLRIRSKRMRQVLRPLVRRLFLHKAGLDRCSQLIVGSAVCSRQLIRDYQDLGIEIHNAYGLTEAPLVTLNRLGRNRPDTVGEPLPETVIQIAADGQVRVRGPQVTPGYFEPDLESPVRDGWLETGDIGFLTAEGSLVLTGRKKELIINAYGKNIDPLGIEARLRSIPEVSEVMLVGEGRPCLAALFWVESDCDPKTIALAVRQINKDLSRPEQIKKWAMLRNDLSVGSGDLTANLKLKRELLVCRYREVIDSLYRGIRHPFVLHLGQSE
ncbi:AMP-binding protein [candidate division KSB1 bacterium]|nr:AMP-binding protein [candidate division KSB1 bacterium]